MRDSLTLSRLALAILIGTVSVLTDGCTSAPHPSKELKPNEQTFPLMTFSTDLLFEGEGKPQCKSMLDSYCTFLHSPEVLGNLEIKQNEKSTKVLQGDTHNQFTQIFYRYSLAKIRNKEHLPKDFARVLDRHAYFGKLKQFLEREPRAAMNLAQRLASEQTDFELGFIWQAAFNETTIVRMNHKYPNFHQLPDKLVPLELQLERRRIRRELMSEVSRAIWRNSEEWRKVEGEFLRLQQSFLNVIGRLDIPEDVRKDWAKRIQELLLVLPGAFPAISTNEECSTTTSNAFYYTYLNVVTICAGDFNSEDIAQTLAHEMAHTLGIDRTQYLFEINSEFGRQLSDVRRKVCSPKTFSCKDWTEFKANFNKSIDSLTGFTPQLPEFHRCLKRHPTSKNLTDEDIQRFTHTIISDRISELASSDRFLRITKPDMPLRNGKMQKNPNYLNPCSYYLWSQGEEPVDDELATLVFFTAEYRCTEEKFPSQRLKGAIELARDLSEKVMQRTLRVEGEFSARNLLETDGFSSPPVERFADVMGSYALAELLSHSKNIWERQNRFLATSSWQCAEPSLASQYPEESSIENDYIFEAHTEGDQRKKELFSAPIRSVIGCQKDFEFKECILPIKTRDPDPQG